MDSTIVLEWTFTPKDFFEEDLELSALGHTVRISAGNAETLIRCNDYEETMEGKLHELLEARFRAGLFLGHSNYKLSKPRKTVVHPDGRKDFYLLAESGRMAISGAPSDIRIVDKDGKVKYDSKRERIEKRNTIGELLAKHSKNSLLRKMTDSYKAAVGDPHDELVHLYEIRDAARKAFGGEKVAQEALGVTSSKWGDFGKVCNELGRHRGAKLEDLRKPSQAELECAREFARSLIEGYLRHLNIMESKGRPKELL